MTQQQVAMIGVPMDLGGGRRGVDSGPSALRSAGIGPALGELGIGFEDWGNVEVREAETLDSRHCKARFLPEISECCVHLCEKVREALKAERMPLVVGGDHSIACGTVAGLARHHRDQGEKIGLIWFDAHGDMNTPETTL